MSPHAFASTVLGWHDFFLATAGAAAALLGLLFVGVSINLAAIAADERVDLRARAGQAFRNLIFVLVIALIMLIPDPRSQALAIGFGALALFGLIRVAQNVYSVLRARKRIDNPLATLRRVGWTAIADLLLIYVATRLWFSADPGALGLLNVVVFVLLVGAADLAWEMLVEVSREGLPRAN